MEQIVANVRRNADVSEIHSPPPPSPPPPLRRYFTFVTTYPRTRVFRSCVPFYRGNISSFGYADENLMIYFHRGKPPLERRRFHARRRLADLALPLFLRSSLLSLSLSLSACRLALIFLHAVPVRLVRGLCFFLRACPDSAREGDR